MGSRSLCRLLVCWLFITTSDTRPSPWTRVIVKCLYLKDFRLFFLKSSAKSAKSRWNFLKETLNGNRIGHYLSIEVKDSETAYIFHIKLSVKDNKHLLKPTTRPSITNALSKKIPNNICIEIFTCDFHK